MVPLVSRSTGTRLILPLKNQLASIHNGFSKPLDEEFSVFIVVFAAVTIGYHVCLGHVGGAAFGGHFGV